ncbi:uncharacterized protein LOC131228601 isoform X2 [Magnolia sinica]|uniref:uncharacterized protein LOC131228601 isoform X2 n=1 Tax=Magnolia sinica TaxID=86752 RepID=UPI0026590E53|nr:uncharacterized protein LOC131228601 isoform X2 [Magnolia sinica]
MKKEEKKKKITERFVISPSLALLLYLFIFSISNSISVVSAGEEISIATHPTTLLLSSGRAVENSPGSKPGTLMVCERIHIRGQPRLQNLGKYAHSLKVKVNITQTSSRAHPRNIEVCFHRNASLQIGMCPQNEWEKLEFRLYRVIFLVLGIVMMTLAPALSNSVIFYYSSAMTVGIVLVILMVLFQGMKLLPTGRKSSLAICMYSSIVGVGSFLLSYLSGLLRSVLVQIGISEDMYSPVAIFLLVSLVLAGAWLGFWGVRKLILTEDGSVDINVAHFVSWSIWIFAAVMILQSSLDALLATEALVSGIIVSSITRKIGNSRFLRHSFKYSFRTAKSILKHSHIQRSDDDSYAEYMGGIRRSKTGSLRSRTRPFKLASCTSPVQGLTKTPPHQPSGTDTYYSTFHNTPERKRFSKEEWETFTRDSTRKALEGLVSSPDFTQWAVANADRITLTPTDDSKTKPQQQRWLRWFQANWL